MRRLGELFDVVRSSGKPVKIAVVAGHDENVLKSVAEAQSMGIAESILYGDTKETEKLAEALGVDLSELRLIHAPDPLEAARMAVETISKGEADLLMKGKIKTGELMSLVLQKEYGLRTGRTLSMVSVFEIPSYPKLLIVSDAGMIISPDLQQKVDMIENTVRVAQILGIDTPKVAIIGAVEVVNPKMPVTLDAAALAKMSDRHQLKHCVVDGPFALDNAVSREAALHKGIESPVAGDADVLIMPDIEAGNVFYKAMVFLANAKVASSIVGARVPVVLTSRADNDETKLLSIALSALIALKG
ncbi:MAG: phosphate butyryltransferase [Thermotogae bacterium]|nr:MAG: phosphate butyryltransferase [Thermotogota bacterium]